MLFLLYCIYKNILTGKAAFTGEKENEMSNGTRIDPEEREPRAIKIRQPKHTGRKILLSLLAVLFAFAIISAGVLAYINFGDYFEFDKFGKTAQESSGSESDIPEDSEPEEPFVPEEPISAGEVTSEPETEDPAEAEPVPEEDPIPRDEWFMLLINRENPLPENYSVETVLIDNNNHTVDSRIAEDLSAMISAGEAEGLKFVFYTAFRSVNKQRELFESGKTDAAPGTSEHNSGLAVDIGCLYGEFEGSPEETWLLSHAHEFGFILRYPKGKEDITGFTYEPWHFRYVGKEQAKLIFESGLCLEEYLAQ